MADLTVAVSESAFQRLFVVLRDSIRWEAQDSTSFGPFTAGYHVKGHLEGGSVDFRADNSILIDELDVRWDKFELRWVWIFPKFVWGAGVSICRGRFRISACRAGVSFPIIRMFPSRRIWPHLWRRN